MNYKSMRVEGHTLIGLQRYRDALQVQVNANRTKYARFAPSFRVSLGDAIDYLIEQKNAHTRRGKGFDAGGRAKDTFCDALMGKQEAPPLDGSDDPAE